MKGAMVFLLIFLLLFALTISYGNLPPGDYIASEMDIPETTYKVLGIPARLFAVSILNGVIYGVIAWLIYSILVWLFSRGKK